MTATKSVESGRERESAGRSRLAPWDAETGPIPPPTPLPTLHTLPEKENLFPTGLPGELRREGSPRPEAGGPAGERPAPPLQTEPAQKEKTQG